MSLPVLSIEQMREWEKASWAAGRSEADVIRRVGRLVAERALDLTEPGDEILILAGKGHNGEDARAAQPHLTGRDAVVLDVADPREALDQWEGLTSRSAPGSRRPKPGPALIIDGLFGIGLARSLDEFWQKLIQTINAAEIPVLAVDVPSGLNADTGEPEGAAINALLTLTVGAPKAGMLKPSAWPYVGRLEVARDVGLIPCPYALELNWTVPDDFAGFPPVRAVAGHKGSFGHLAIMAGSVGYHGAAVLAARGAQRARPGLISVFTHEAAYHAIAAQLQAVMVHPWTRDADLSSGFSAVLVGPGLAARDLPDEMKALVRRLWKNLQAPMIVDASALDWLPLESAARNGLRVITPHPGEAARLLQTKPEEVQADRPQALRKLSRRFSNTWVVLKGHQTLVGRSTGPRPGADTGTPPDPTNDVFVNPSGNPYLAQGGAGDVLSGYLAGLLAQPELCRDTLRTLRFAVWQHGAAADALQASRPNWTIEDFVETLGLATPDGGTPAQAGQARNGAVNFLPLLRTIC